MTDQHLDDSKAPLIEHLIELRQRLMWVIGGIFVAFIFCFIFASTIFNILLQPYAVAADVPIEEIVLQYTAPQEYFFTQLKLGLFGAIFIAFPIIATQIYQFVAPGLYKNEKSAFLPFLIATPILFLMGGALVYFGAMPLAMRFFLGMEQSGEGVAKIQLIARVSEYLGLIMTLILAFGISFQLPVVLTLLAKAGIVTSEGLRSRRKYAVVGVFAFAAFMTPPDPISQIGLALPTLLLYELSIYSARYVEKQREEADRADDENADTDT